MLAEVIVNTLFEKQVDGPLDDHEVILLHILPKDSDDSVYDDAMLLISRNMRTARKWFDHDSRDLFWDGNFEDLYH